MARIRNGILGGFAGKVGEVIGQNYGGISTMRAMPKYVSNPRTPKQTAHRELWADLSLILKQSAYILKTTLWNDNVVYNGFNKAMSYNYRNAVVNGNIDLSSLVFGEVVGLDFSKLDFTYLVEDGYIKLIVSWEGDANGIDKFVDDQAIIVVVLEKDGKLPTTVLSEYLTESRGEEGAIKEVVFTLFPADSYDNEDYVHIYWGIWSPSLWELINNNIPARTIPAHNIPAFKPSKSFVSEVKKNNGIKK